MPQKHSRIDQKIDDYSGHTYTTARRYGGKKKVMVLQGGMSG